VCVCMWCAEKSALQFHKYFFFVLVTSNISKYLDSNTCNFRYHGYCENILRLRNIHLRHGLNAFLVEGKWPKKMTWTGTHACNSKIKKFPEVISRFVGRCGTDGQTDLWLFYVRIITVSFLIRSCRLRHSSGRFPAAAARVRSHVRSCGIFGGKSGAGARFLRVLWFPLTILIPPTASHSSSSMVRGRYIGQTVADVPSGFSLTPPKETIKNIRSCTILAIFTVLLNTLNILNNLRNRNFSVSKFHPVSIMLFRLKIIRVEYLISLYTKTIMVLLEVMVTQLSDRRRTLQLLVHNSAGRWIC
jgi:hypothetical protein